MLLSNKCLPVQWYIWYLFLVHVGWALAKTHATFVKCISFTFANEKIWFLNDNRHCFNSIALIKSCFLDVLQSIRHKNPFETEMMYGFHHATFMSDMVMIHSSYILGWRMFSMWTHSYIAALNPFSTMDSSLRLERLQWCTTFSPLGDLHYNIPSPCSYKKYTAGENTLCI